MRRERHLPPQGAIDATATALINAAHGSFKIGRARAAVREAALHRSAHWLAAELRASGIDNVAARAEAERLLESLSGPAADGGPVGEGLRFPSGRRKHGLDEYQARREQLHDLGAFLLCRTDDDLHAFAQVRGPLGVCSCTAPLQGHVRSGVECRRLGWEPLDAWRAWRTRAQTIATLRLSLASGSSRRQRQELERMINDWCSSAAWAPLVALVRPDGVDVQWHHPTLLAALGNWLMLAMQKGHLLWCATCGAPFVSANADAKPPKNPRCSNACKQAAHRRKPRD